MRRKFNCFLVIVLTAFLAGAVFSCAPVSAVGGAITFVCRGREYVYNPDAVDYDEYDHDTLASLERRGFFGGAAEKLAVADRVSAMGFDAETALNYVMPGLKEIVDEIASDVFKAKKDSEVVFRPDGEKIFSVSEGSDGEELDRKALYDRIRAALGGGTVEVPVNTVKAVSKAENLKKTSLKAVFSTDYGSSTADRKSNVKLALSKFNGMVVAPGERVSFNDTVGERTAANGFKKAKIIVGGKYVDGVGGGVCQASTTLYNAALLAGLRIDEWHRHTLRSGYVKPSFDAMVNSNGADMVFTNDSGSPLYIRTVCDGSRATVYIYGEPNQYEIAREYKTVKTTPAKVTVITDTDGKYADRVVYDDESFWLKAPTDGVSTEGYLVYKKDGRTVARKKIRKDTYQPVCGVKVVGAEKRPAENPDAAGGENAA